MPLLGNLIQRGVHLAATLQHVRDRSTPAVYQDITLRRLLRTAEDTAFGRHYGFDSILRSDAMVRAFQERVPVFDYDRMHEAWWHRALADEADVSWPGTIPYFAKSSGTSGATSKHIPVSHAMVRALKRAAIKHIYALSAFHLPAATFEKDVLILGGSTGLAKQGGYHVGDLSGISAAKVPAWFQRFYRPGPAIALESDWPRKLQAIAEAAPDWDVGVVCGLPAWVQLLFRKIIEVHDAATVHDVWPNLSVFVHGGVAFGPYRRTFLELVARPLVTMETYVASEGYIAFQPGPQSDMQMLLNGGVFFEFVPFNDDNFDADGQISDDAAVRSVGEVEAGVPYALLLSTCAGAWRYLLGDVIEFTDVEEAKIRFAGRTQHFLNFCGEHLSGVNMNRAAEMLGDQLGMPIPEYTVAGTEEPGGFGHHWFVAADRSVDVARMTELLDGNLKAINDDYRTKRGGPLKAIYATPIPTELFYEWMRRQGKFGGQNKFPRVLRGEKRDDWLRFLKEQRIEATMPH